MAIDQHQDLHVAVRKEPLSEAKRRLLQQRLRGVGLSTASDRIRPRAAGAAVPLSAEQRRIWLHASQQPDVPVYNEPITIHRKGSFDLATLEASMDEILLRHETWRTSFTPEGEAVIHPPMHLTLPLIDLSHLPEGERDAEAVRLATADARKKIPLDSAPLFRPLVVRLAPDEHRLYLTFHHVVFDGVSIARIFVPELAAIYAAFERGQPSPFPTPELQYSDYAIWRAQHVQSSEVQRHLGYWLDHLSGELPVLTLPEDRPRPSIASHAGAMELFDAPADLTEQLRYLCRSQGVTLYVALFAAFNALLFRYSDQNDLIVGSITDGRRRAELEGVLGCFLDTFAVRTRPAADLRFSEFLAQTRDAVLGGLAAAEVPFDRVVREINPKRDPSQHPIFQAFFSMRPPMPPLPEGWLLTESDVTVGTTKFDLYFEFCEHPESIESRILYGTEIWDAATVKRMAAHWLQLLRSICRNPETTLGSLSMLTPAETASILEPGGWNDTARSYPQAPLNVLIEEQVRRTPRAIAASFGKQRWTYQELNARAESLASVLRSKGVARGSIVAIVLDRSLDMLAGLIAVLKTGAAYLPIDIQMPRERIALYIANAEPAAILTQNSLVDRITSTASTLLVLVDQDRAQRPVIAINAAATRSTPLVSDLEDSAYLIYTSGTTGAPKAVELTQANLVNLLASMQAAPGFGREDVLLAVTPISFDIAALELFLPLICGGKVVIASREEAQDPYLLAAAIESSGCTVMQATPSTWRTLLLSGWRNARQGTKHGPSSLVRVLCGGEGLPRELATRLLATGVELWNMYGPTETTIWSTIHRVDRNEKGPVPVGLPIANTTAFILDRELQPRPVGVPGELFLGGIGLAKGYRGQPQLTSERFATVETVGGVRLYRTGDLAVRRADGTIQVLGRTDNQVKIRGHRIELEAVEAAVMRHPQVASAAARAWPETSGDLRLCIYVVAKDGSAPTNAELRAFLSTSLPESMIPSDVIPLSLIPLTPHGKVDRAKLPAPVASLPAPIPSTQYSLQEARIAAIWKELLGRKQVGLDDNFFDMGGHSLLVAALQQRLATEFGERIPIAELFHRSTVRQQSALTERGADGKPVLPPGVIALQPHGTRDSIFWIHVLNRNLPKEIGTGQPFYFVTLTAEEVAPLSEDPSLQNIAAYHVRKILATQSEGPYVIGGLCVGSILAYEIASQIQATGREVSLLVLLDAPNPSYLESYDSLKYKFSYFGYLLKRAGRLGLRVSLLYLRDHLLKRFPETERPGSVKTEWKIAQEMIVAAALKYEPHKYVGKVLLLLASERPPHMNYAPGWQAVVSQNLHIQYVDGHHRELIQTPDVRSVADAIVSHLRATTDGKSLPRVAETTSGVEIAI